MEYQIHCMEVEAYGAVLKAFIAQSDVLSWGKEGLISELRKELRVSDVEHREILGKVNSDSSVRAIREFRLAADNQQALLPNMSNVSGIPSNPILNVPQKKQKITNISTPSSQIYLSRSQPSPAVVPPSAANLYTEDQWGNNNAVFPSQPNSGNPSRSASLIRQTSSTGKGRGLASVQMQNESYGQLRNGTSNSGADTIEIMATDELIDEIQRVCGVQSPDPAQLERAKQILKEQERALIDALNKLSDVADDDNAPDQWKPPSMEKPRNGHGFQNGGYVQTEGGVRYYSVPDDD